MIETSSFARLRAYRMGLLVMVLGILVPVSLAGPADAKTLTVNSTQDFSDVYPGDGVCDTIAIQLLNPCALRGAMQEANSLAGMDVIYFDIPGGGARTIEPNSQLPVVTQQVTIDRLHPTRRDGEHPGRGNNAVLRIELDGSSAPGALLPDGLLISASDSVVRGLVINNFSGEGVQLSGSNNRLGGNFIGTNANGNVSFEFRPAQAVPTGQTVTATATNSGGNTSEFSAPRTAAKYPHREGHPHRSPTRGGARRGIISGDVRERLSRQIPPPDLAGRLHLQGRQGQGYLRWQGQERAQQGG